MTHIHPLEDSLDAAFRHFDALHWPPQWHQLGVECCLPKARSLLLRISANPTALHAVVDELESTARNILKTRAMWLERTWEMGIFRLDSSQFQRAGYDSWRLKGVFDCLPETRRVLELHAKFARQPFTPLVVRTPERTHNLIMNLTLTEQSILAPLAKAVEMLRSDVAIEESSLALLPCLK